MPHGPELIHLEYVSRAAKGALAREETARVRALTREGVDVRFDLACPLYADTQGVPVARVTVPSLGWHKTAGRERTLNEDLLERGLGLDPLETSDDETAIWDSDFFAADQEARGRKAGIYAAPLETFEVATVTSSAAARALGEARAFLEAEGCRIQGNRVVELVDDVAMAAQMTAHGFPATPSKDAYGFSPPGPTIYIRDRIPLAYGRPADRILRTLLIHELVHAWQLGKRPKLFDGSAVTSALLEGHAQYWSHRVARKNGLLEDWNAVTLTGRQYARGFAFWRSVYSWLEANGVAITLADENVPLIEGLHALLLGPQAPEDPAVLDDPMQWLGATLPGFPAPHWVLEVDRVTPVEGGGVMLAWKLTNSSRTRTLSLCLHSGVAVEAHELRDREPKRLPVFLDESAGDTPAVVLIPPGESRPLPLTLRIEAGEPLPASRTLLVKTRLVTFGEGGPLFFNAVTSKPFLLQKP
jgi:hypothetical protein